MQGTAPYLLLIAALTMLQAASAFAVHFYRTRRSADKLTALLDISLFSVSLSVTLFICISCHYWPLTEHDIRPALSFFSLCVALYFLLGVVSKYFGIRHGGIVPRISIALIVLMLYRSTNVWSLLLAVLVPASMFVLLQIVRDFRTKKTSPFYLVSGSLLIVIAVSIALSYREPDSGLFAGTNDFPVVLVVLAASAVLFAFLSSLVFAERVLKGFASSIRAVRIIVLSVTGAVLIVSTFGLFFVIERYDTNREIFRSIQQTQTLAMQKILANIFNDVDLGDMRLPTTFEEQLDKAQARLSEVMTGSFVLNADAAIVYANINGDDFEPVLMFSSNEWRDIRNSMLAITQVPYAPSIGTEFEYLVVFGQPSSGYVAEIGSNKHKYLVGVYVSNDLMHRQLNNRIALAITYILLIVILLLSGGWVSYFFLVFAARKQESEKLTRLILDNSPVGVMSYDPKTLAIVGANSALLDILGLSKSELLAKTVPDIFMNKESFDEEETGFLVSDDLQNERYRIVTPQGKDKLLSAKWRRFTQEGHTYGLAVIEDVTESQKYISRVERHQEQLMAVNKIAAELIFGGPELEQDQIVETSRKLFQYIVDEARKIVDADTGVLVLLDPDTSNPTDYFASNFDTSCLIGGAHISFCGAFERFNQGEKIFTKDITSEPNFRGFPPGHPVIRGMIGLPLVEHDRVFGVFLLGNFTLEKSFSSADEETLSLISNLAKVAYMNSQNAMSIRNMADFNRKIIQTVPTPVFVASPDLHIITVNDSFCRATGYASEQLVGKSLKEIFIGCKQGDEVSDSDNVVEAHMKIKTANEECIEILISRTSIYDKYERKYLVVGAFIDISDLIRQREAAERASIAKGEFLANMSHEIRTPLNGIVGTINLLKDTPLNFEQQEYLAIVNESAQSLVTIINDILDLSKIEAGRLSIEIEPFHLPLTIERTIELFTNVARDKGVDLLTTLDPRLPVGVSGDSVRFRQILINLLSNAIKFTESGEIELSADVIEETETSVKLLIKVRDTGIGIPADRIERIFDSFTQAESSTTRRFGGTGLGLTICRKLATALNGEIWVESEQGKGSTFFITLPFPKAELKDERNAIVPELVNTRCLLALANTTERMNIKKMLESCGIAVELASSGTNALRLLERSIASGDSITLVMLEDKLSDMSGIETARFIRASLKYGKVPIILLSGETRPKRDDSIEEVGISTIVPKPWKRSTMVAAALEATKGVRISEAKMAQSSAQASEAKWLLLAEDHAINRKIITVMLERLGYKVEHAANGVEAVEKADSKPFAAILMDVSMPEMDGLEATRRIRSNPAMANVPIIAMTAHAMQDDRDRCMQAGMNDYLAKPVNKDELLATMSRWNASPPQHG